jgi:catechol 2,3-dioxygenase-like lactoylglutathione lyase family enzyme
MEDWPPELPVSAVRIARPTDRLDQVVHFYRDALGLPEIGRFAAHDGYDGVMLGLPGEGTHLEFTQTDAGSPCPAPTADNLLVLYFADATTRDTVALRLQTHGHDPVPPENPYWRHRALTFADPDGWRVVLVDSAWRPTPQTLSG